MADPEATRSGGAGDFGCVSRRLLGTAAAARELLDAGAVGRIAGFVRGCRVPGRGFCGRSAEPDLYYTMFALWCFRALGVSWDLEDARGALCGAVPLADLDLAHLVCAVEIQSLLAEAEVGEYPREAEWAERLEAWRRPDGGYAAARQSRYGSLGSTYLALLAYQRLGRPMPQEESVIGFVSGQRLGDGFADGRAMGRATVVSTAAAVTILRALAPEIAPDGRWLWSCFTPHQGGFLPFDAAPEADLLSTAVALFALQDTLPPGASAQPVLCRFIQALWAANNGFCGSLGDGTADCEYTFYALLALGAIHSVGHAGADGQGAVR